MFVSLVAINLSNGIQSKYMADTQEIKNKIDVVDFIGAYVKLMPAGKNFKGLCPFHKEKSPSFMVTRDRQSWHCFGCNEGGDIFKFLMQFEHLEFFEALKILAERAGVELKGGQGMESYRELYEVNLVAKDFFKQELQKLGAHQEHARAYLQSRGLKKETIDTFEIGVASTSSDALLRYLIAAKKSLHDIERAGLVFRSERGTYFDRFRGRIMFPLYNSFGKVVGFTGRVLPGSEQLSGFEAAKYVNSPETPIFSKSKLLYGFYAAKQHIRETKTVVIVEGQMDFLMSWQDGVKNVVASSGTALTVDQLTTLRRIADTVILSFDTDAAGIAAAERSIDTAHNMDFTVRLLEVVGYKDPADAVLGEPGAMARFIVNAKPALTYYIDRYIRDGDEAAVQKRNVRIVLAKIKQMESAIERQHAIRALGERAGLSEEVLMEELQRVVVANAPVIKKRQDEIAAVYEEKRSRSGAISERLLGLALVDATLLKEMESMIKFMEEPYRMLYGHIVNGSLLDVPGPLRILADKISLSGGLLGNSGEKGESVVLCRELKQEYLKGRSEALRRAIALAERQGDETALGNALKEFDETNKALHTLS